MSHDPLSLDPELTPRLSVQRYGAEARIEGVEVRDLVRHVDDGGSLVELARLDGGALKTRPGFRVRQVNYSILEPGTIKAFHLHLRQSELWFAAPGARLLVGLLDARRDSPTRRAVMRFVLGDGRSALLHIPAGVAHGVSNPGERPAALVYLADQEFDPDPERCDERRLPWDTLGADFWERQRG